MIKTIINYAVVIGIPLLLLSALAKTPDTCSKNSDGVTICERK